METQPLITTIIPTFRRPHLLKRAVHSALNQTFTHVVVAVFDNHSEDETAQIINEIAKQDSRLQYFCHPSTIHPIENFQFGISKVKTPFFSILADDDLLLPKFYETALAMLKKYPSAQFFLGSVIDIHQNGDLISAEAQHWTTQEYYQPPAGIYPIIRHYFNWIGGLFRTHIAQKTFLDPRITAIDFDFILRMAAQHPFVFSKTPCAYFVHHPGSFSTRCGLKLIWPGYVYMIENLRPLLSAEIQEHVFLAFRQTLKTILLRIALLETNRKNVKEARRVLQLAQTECGPCTFLVGLQIYLAITSKIPCFYRVFSFLLMLRNHWKQWVIRRGIHKTLSSKNSV